MIEEKVKINNRFSVEIKLSYLARKKKRISEFAVNTWIFIPNSLDINPLNYDKKDFYRDLKTHTRLFTPVFLLRDIASAGNSPLRQLESAFRHLASEPTRTNQAQYEHHIKMFQSILKSALRDETNHIIYQARPEDRNELVMSLLESLSKIAKAYRSLRSVINVPTVGQQLQNYYRFGDEFMGNITEQHCFRLLRLFSPPGVPVQGETALKIMEFIEAETQYKEAAGYHIASEKSNDNNREMIHRLGFLKKYIEDVLFLFTTKKKDGQITEQVYFSIAAGISMVFATAIAFSFQQKYGNLTMPFFVALVVSYMLKDRIKELGRYYFAHRLGRSYFDNKTSISLNDNIIGWSKEAVDFIAENKVPKDALKLRGRSDILQANNRIHNEKIILYRKLIRLNRKSLDRCGNYFFAGINDIIRLNVASFVHKMDNPEFYLFVSQHDHRYDIIDGEKVYFLNLVMQLKSEEEERYHRYRITFNRNGIFNLESFET